MVEATRRDASNDFLTQNGDIATLKEVNKFF